MNKVLVFISLFLLWSCSVQEPKADRQIDALPDIYPDYIGVTIPSNIAPLRFMLKTDADDAIAVLNADTYNFIEKAEAGKFLFDESDWSKLLNQAKGQDIQVKTYVRQDGMWAAYKEFSIHVAKEDIDSHLAYRLIPPGYEPWYKMGIYQRDITNFEEKAILTNSQTDENCMNCHSFPNQDPNKMLFHMRAVYGGTYIVDGNEVEKIDGKVADKITSFVYPSWHPSGEYVAFSTNKTLQAFHRNDSNRIEVYDEKSDVFVYDLKRHKVLTDSLLFSRNAFETFPTFSPDGKSLFFCSAIVSDTIQMPRDYKSVKYNLCRIDFNPDENSFGTVVDTIYSVKTEGRSAKFPRVSPDGKYLVFTVSDYGNFSIWHHDADMFIYDFNKKTYKPLDEANSKDTESYHSWSHNSRWLVFSSRRDDGLYTRPYITYIDENGKSHKPFMLPQEDPDFYRYFFYSYNIPEFIQGEVKINSDLLIKTAKNGTAKQIGF